MKKGKEMEILTFVHFHINITEKRNVGKLFEESIFSFMTDSFCGRPRQMKQGFNLSMLMAELADTNIFVFFLEYKA